MNDKQRKEYEDMLREGIKLANAVGVPLTQVKLPKTWSPKVK